MGEVSIIGPDLAKNVLQVNDESHNGSMAFRRKLSHAQPLEFIAAQPRCVVAMDACASSSYWGGSATGSKYSLTILGRLMSRPNFTLVSR